MTGAGINWQPVNGALVDPLVGQRVGRNQTYEIRRWLGAGGSSDVYLAWDRNRDRFAAVKLLRSRMTADLIAKARFAREGAYLGDLEHPNIVRVLECGEHAGRPLIVSLFVAGRSLRALMDEQRPLEIALAVRIARDVARGLACAHAGNIVHRDVTPENIMIRSCDGRAVLIDFGIAKNLQSGRKLTQTGKCVGTPGYSAPEQLKCGRVDERCDIFALGVVLHEMVTGTTAFGDENTREIDQATLKGPPLRTRQLNRRVPKGLAGLIRRMTQRQPLLRIRPMSKVVSRLDAIGASLRIRKGCD